MWGNNTIVQPQIMRIGSHDLLSKSVSFVCPWFSITIDGLNTFSDQFPNHECVEKQSKS